MRVASALASGAMTTSVKILAMARAASRVERAVDRDDAAEGADRIAGERLAIGLGQLAPTATPQGLACLMMAQAAVRAVEFGDAFEGGVGVVDIVVGELLALHLACGGDAGARRGVR